MEQNGKTDSRLEKNAEVATCIEGTELGEEKVEGLNDKKEPLGNKKGRPIAIERKKNWAEVKPQVEERGPIVKREKGLIMRG